MTRLHASRRFARLVGPGALVLVVAMGAAGCSGSESDGGPSSSASQADETAKEALDAGLKAHADGDLSTAAEEYEKVLKSDPDNKYALFNLALIDEASKNYGLAEEKYRKALEAAPGYEPALFNLAILVTERDPDEAISLYQRAVEAKPSDASAWLNLGLLLRAAGRTDEGDEAVEKAISLNPELTDPAS